MKNIKNGENRFLRFVRQFNFNCINSSLCRRDGR